MAERISETYNWPLVTVVGLLSAIGVVNLYSALSLWEESGAASLFWNQVLWMVLGIGMMIFLSLLDYRVLERLGPFLYILAIAILAITLFVGAEIRGARGWLSLGPIRVQPAEFAKLGFILIAARYFGRRPAPDGYGVFTLWQPLFLMALPCVLIVLQGDMGSALFFLCIFVTLAVFGRIRRSLLIFSIVALFAGGALVYTFGLKDYQRARIETFLHPEKDTQGSGYQIMQSRIAVGSGMIFGKGYLHGNINKLRYLPERHTDFIFPVFAEEWGFFGSSIVIALYLALLLMGVEIAKKARDRFGVFLAMGIVALIFWQVVINLGGVLGLLPLTGVTLPLLSYGGSSLITTFASLGILLNISLRRFMF